MVLPARTIAVGNPPSASHQVSQTDLADWMEYTEEIASLSGISHVADTFAELGAVTGSADGVLAWVTRDPSSNLRGTYRWESSAWSKIADLPPGIATAADAAEIAEARDEVRAIAASAGIDHFADTLAQAQAALPGYSDGDVVSVFADEANEGLRTLYQVEGGALAFKVVLSTTKAITALFSDEGDGLTRQFPLPIDPVLAKYVQVFVGGRRQFSPDDFVLVAMGAAPSGKGIEFDVAPPDGVEIEGAVVSPSAGVSATDAELILLDGGISIASLLEGVGGISTRADLVTWWGTYAALVPAGTVVSDGTDTFVVMGADHPDFGTDPIPDLPGLALFGASKLRTELDAAQILSAYTTARDA